MAFCSKILRRIQAKNIEEDDLGKAKQFRLFSIQRPYMRSFHSSWFCFFVAFTAWFGLQPLLPTIRKELKLSKVDLANSGIASVSATIAVRLIVGPLCDIFGPRRIMSILLISGAIPMALAGLINDGTGLIILRLFIGILGGSFVPCQFWTSAMFSQNIVGTANALVGGWGNLGGGFTFILMPGLFQLIKICGADEFLAWKIAVAIPAAICVAIGVSILFTSDDCPQGRWEKRKLPDQESSSTHGHNHDSNVGVINTGFKGQQTDSFKSIDAKGSEITRIQQDEQEHQRHCSSNMCCISITTLSLILQYGMCFGIEISVNTVMNLYFLYRFKVEDCVEDSESSLLNETTTQSPSNDVNPCSILDQDTASLIASLFGLMNLFARAMGGIFSDTFQKYFHVTGRLLAHFICLFGEGAMLIIFSKMTTIPSAIGVMILFSVFVQMSEGTTYAIVPYVAPRHVGIVAGFVGAGGNAGAMIWNTIWSRLVDKDPSRWFLILGITVLCGTSLTFLEVVHNETIFHIHKYCKGKTNRRPPDVQDTKL